MKIAGIEARLKEEFPDRYVSFSIDVTSGEYGGTETEIKIYTPGIGHVDCTDLEDGIRRLKEKLGSVRPSGDLELEF